MRKLIALVLLLCFLLTGCGLVDRVKEFLKEHPQMTDEIYAKIMAKVNAEKEEKERLARERTARIQSNIGEE